MYRSTSEASQGSRKPRKQHPAAELLLKMRTSLKLQSSTRKRRISIRSTRKVPMPATQHCPRTRNWKRRRRRRFSRGPARGGHSAIRFSKAFPRSGTARCSRTRTEKLSR